MIIAIIFFVVMFAFAAYLAWTIWEAYGEARNERVERARRRRVIQEAEYQIHTKASTAFQNMMRVAREQTDGCRGHR